MSVSERLLSTPVATVRPGSGAFRHLRAMSAALACVASAFGAHVLAGGQAEPATVAAVFGISGAVAWALARVRLTSPQLLGLLVLGQIGVHVVAMASATGHATPMDASMLAIHAAATLLSWWALSRGEAFVWAVAQHLALRPLALLLQCWSATPARAPIAFTPVVVRPSLLHLALTPVRGPPAKPAFVHSP